MTVLARLRALYDPIAVEWGDEEWLTRDPDAAYFWTPRAVRFRSAVLKRIQEAGAALSIRHTYRRIQGTIVAAIRLATPEMKWFRDMASSAKPSGKENRLDLRLR